MKTAIILHGMPSQEEYHDPNTPSQSNLHWLPWIQRQLILKGILAQTPELPEPYTPVYENWRKVFEQFTVDENTILIGHSCGAGFLVRWLSENKIKIGKVALVAPFIDPDHDEVPGDFFRFQIDPAISARSQSVGIIYSTNDDQEIVTSVNQIATAINDVDVIRLSGKGHLTAQDLKSDQLPELLDWLLIPEKGSQ